MANVTVTLADILKANEASPAGGVTPSTFAADDTVKVPMDDKNVVVAITASATGTVTVSAGDGIGGVADLVLSVPQDKTVFVQLDSSSYEQITGDNKGYAILTPSGAGSIVAVSTL